MVGPAAQHEGVAHLQAVMDLSKRRGCSIVNAERTMIRYRSCRPPDAERGAQLRDLANERKRFRLPASVRPAAQRRRAVQDQPHLPPLSRGGPHGAQAAGAAAHLGTRAPILVEAVAKPAGLSTSSTINLPAAGDFGSSTSSTT
jgi:putative transposase